MFKMTPESQKLNPQTPDGVPCKPQTPNPKPLIKPKPSSIMILGCWAEGGRRPVKVSYLKAMASELKVLRDC